MEPIKTSDAEREILNALAQSLENQREIMNALFKGLNLGSISQERLDERRRITGNTIKHIIEILE